MNKEIEKLFDFKGEVAIVTGGLGQLGSEYARILAMAGVKVEIFDIKNGLSEKIRAMVVQGLPIAVHQVDILDRNAVRRAFETLAKAGVVPTILVNNAGIDTPPNAPSATTGSFEEYPEEAWNAVIDSHIKGAFLVSQEFLRNLKDSVKRGSIINISSTYGMVAPDQSVYDFRRKNDETFYKPVAYSVAKAGMLNFTRWLAEYCRMARIPCRVNTLVLGGVINGQREEFIREYSRRTILERMAYEDEYNAAVLFLASHNASSYMTGSTLVIDGGWTAR